MENILKAADSSIIFLIIGVLLAVLIVLSIIKQFFKIVILLVILTALYAGYLYTTGRKLPENSDQLIKQGAQQIEVLKEKGGRLIPEKK
jgi:membrane protein implicated in regulation of membrane protease activity